MPIKKQYILIVIAGFFIFLFTACTQYKNKFINRTYHDITLHYNVYFYAKESLKEGVQNLEDNYKDDYTELLPVFKYGDKETCKAIFPQMDRAIKKASEGIQRHAIKDKKSKVEIPNTGRWVDDCWNTIGKAHFYKREFFSAIESFEYVESAYKGKQKEEAKLWLMKCYNELNALSQSDHYASLIKNDKRFPDEFKAHYHALYAEFYIKQGLGQYDEAIKQLTEAIKKTRKKAVKARYHFILGQLYEEKNKREQAMFNYRMVVRLKPPTYELSFYAKVKQALMNKDPESTERAKQELYKMTKDFKNSDLLDVIFYTLGQIDENQKNIDNAFENYILSVQKSVSNNKQKAKSYLKLADISFDKESYVASSRYYDSTIALIKEDYPGYLDIKAKKTSLDSLVKNIVIIKTQDSLLAVAAMDSVSRNKLIKQIIQNLIKHEEDSVTKKQQALSAGGGTPLSPSQGFTPQAQQNGTGPGDWYFYNTLLKAQGLNDFIKRWGANRKNEDNWRRSNKSSFTFDEVAANDKKDSIKGKDSLKLKSNDKHQQAYYLKKLPLTKANQDSSNKKILEAYYALGTIYREMLNNSKKSAQSFETMNKRFPGNKYEAPSYYQLYRIFVQQKNDPKANEAKNFLLTNYPKSDYAKIINDPDFAKSVNAKQSEVDAEYASAYNAYSNKNYTESYTTCTNALMKYGKGTLTPKFAYLRALSSGYLYGVDSLEKNMSAVVIKYQKTEVYDMAKATLDAIKKQKEALKPLADTASSKNLPETTFKINEKAPHYFMVILSNTKDLETIKNKISDLNKEYFSANNYEIVTLPKDEKTMVTIRTFANKDDGMGYYNFILTKPDVFSSIDKRNYSLIVITTDNVGALLKTGNFDEYKVFFDANYLGIKQ